MEITETGCVAVMKIAELASLLPRQSGEHSRSRLVLGGLLGLLVLQCRLVFTCSW
jgi:hypothetical protein